MSVFGDLFLVNSLTIVTEFIGVALALNYFGVPQKVSVPLAAVLLFAVVAGGSFRRWERFLFGLIAVNIVVFPMLLVLLSLALTAARFFHSITATPTGPNGAPPPWRRWSGRCSHRCARPAC